MSQPVNVVAIDGELDKKLSVRDERKRRLLEFVSLYKGKAKGDAIQAAQMMTDEYGTPINWKTKVSLEWAADHYFKKAVSEGLIIKDPEFYLHHDVIPKGKLLDMLSRQAMGDAPTKRREVYRRNSDGDMELSEVHEEKDKMEAQEKLAKILGLYKEQEKAPTVNIALVLGKLTGEDKKLAEDLIIDTHAELLSEGQP